jgi:hypothetical protein
VKKIIAVASLWLLAAGIAAAGEQKLMHCFAFTAVESASPADWQAFYKATDALPGKIPGLTRVWYGKMRRPLFQLQPANEGDYKKIGQAKPGEELQVPVQAVRRQYGVCMEMNDEAALKAYADTPGHKEWVDAYSKVRQEGTTTFDILGQ